MGLYRELIFLRTLSAKRHRARRILFNEPYLFGKSLHREDDAQRRPVHDVADVMLKALDLFYKTIMDSPTHVKLGNIPSIFRFAQGDEHPIAVSLFVGIDGYSWRTLIIHEDGAVSPGHISIGNNVIL